MQTFSRSTYDDLQSREQCAATEDIQERFGLESALDYRRKLGSQKAGSPDAYRRPVNPSFAVQSQG